MPKVHVLPPRIANQIAAGEVVERPSSIVKELVENAIDAGATAITIKLADWTSPPHLRAMASGIADEDCETAFLRHATSKISFTDDVCDSLARLSRGSVGFHRGGFARYAPNPNRRGRARHADSV